MQRNWINVFRLNKYSFVIVSLDTIKERLVFFLDYKNELKNEKSFAVLYPETHEVNEFSSNDYIRKYGPQIKAFLEGELRTLVIDEIIMNAVIQSDKKLNFIRIIHKKSKKIVIFSNPKSIEEYSALGVDFLLISKEKIQQEIEVFANFEMIKKRIAQIYNPFKNPKIAFDKINNAN